MTTCPVLAFTPEVEHALRWFDETYDLVQEHGRWRWRRLTLPGPGSPGDQDAKLMEALALLCRVHNELIAPRPKQHLTNG